MLVQLNSEVTYLQNISINRLQSLKLINTYIPNLPNLQLTCCFAFYLPIAQQEHALRLLLSIQSFIITITFNFQKVAPIYSQSLIFVQQFEKSMGNCMAKQQKLNGIIDNQSSYEIIYHVSGSMKEISQFEEELNVGPKIGLGFEGVEVGGVNYGKKKHSKNQKYFSEARVPKHSFCSAGLNNIEIGCFLSIYATKQNHSGDQVYKKLIFKDICIRTNQDICLRINKNLTIKQLSKQQIDQMKTQFEKAGSKMISTLKETKDVSNSENSSIIPSTTNHLLQNTEYLKKTFGSKYKEHYIRYEQTGLFDLIHVDVKINLFEFLKYDWAYLQALELDGCGIDDNEWFLMCVNARYYFPNLRYLFIAGNKITTIQETDLECFPSLQVLELQSYSINEQNPLTQKSKKNILSFALQHPQVAIYCESIDQKKYLPAQALNPNVQQFNEIENEHYENEGQWFFIFPPQMIEQRNQQSEIRKSTKNYNKQNKPPNKPPKKQKRQGPSLTAPI